MVPSFTPKCPETFPCLEEWRTWSCSHNCFQYEPPGDPSDANSFPSINIWYSTILTEPGWNYSFSIEFVNLRNSTFSQISEISQTVLWEFHHFIGIAPPWHLMHKAPKVSATAPSAPFAQDALDAWGVVQRCCQNNVCQEFCCAGVTHNSYILIPYFLQRNLAWHQPDLAWQISERIQQSSLIGNVNGFLAGHVCDLYYLRIQRAEIKEAFHGPQKLWNQRFPGSFRGAYVSVRPLLYHSAHALLQIIDMF